ncbi:MAG: diacylglycerol kinase family protein [Gemmatimonadales bacterium]
MNAQRIPAFINPESGNGERAREVLAAGPFDLHEVAPHELKDRVAEILATKKPKRILIAGGDGSIRTVAELIVGTEVELAVLPSGTLNHFAKDHRLPTDLEEAARVAVDGVVDRVDAGRVGDRLFHGTSSIGAYIHFMKVRERIEPAFGYRISTLLAGIWTFFRMPTIAVSLEIDGRKHIYRTPLLFVAVGERELKLPTLGGRVDGGRRGLHLMVVRGRTRARLLFLALDAVLNGIREATHQPEFESFIVEACSISMRRRRARISFDGEAEYMHTPLEYRLESDILRLVVPSTARHHGDGSPSV